jgi:glycosyltransferase involved in cell wall biosynthesis
MRYQNRISPSTKYILADFNCSREYTHHAEYLFAFANHLQAMDLEYELWVNRAADSGVKFLLKSHPVNSILNSLDYSFTSNQNFPIFILNKITRSILGNSKVSFLPLGLQEKIVNFAAGLLAHSALKRVRQLSGEYERVVIVFPSVDGLALRFLRRIAAGTFNSVSVSMRLIGAETRGVLGTKDLNSFISQIATGVSDLRIGWEINSMKNRMIESGVQPEKLYWSPIPPTSSPLLKLSNPKRMTLGFLGSARRNKGFSSIPQILNLLRDLDICFQVQEANFEWDGYLASMAELLRPGDRVNFVPGATSNEELNQAMSECSVLVLPYEVDSYRFAGSGIMYQAASIGIPIFCTEGVGFDWDVKNFGIGSTFRSPEELRSLVTNFDSLAYFQKIVEYNEARNLACSEFLG